jgi:hypothetical protein
MKIDINSWHYKLYVQSSEYRHPNSVCEYFGTLLKAFAFYSAILATVLTYLYGWVLLCKLNYIDNFYLTSGFQFIAITVTVVGTFIIMVRFIFDEPFRRRFIGKIDCGQIRLVDSKEDLE